MNRTFRARFWTLSGIAATTLILAIITPFRRTPPAFALEAAQRSAPADPCAAPLREGHERPLRRRGRAALSRSACVSFLRVFAWRRADRVGQQRVEPRTSVDLGRATLGRTALPGGSAPHEL